MRKDAGKTVTITLRNLTILVTASILSLCASCTSRDKDSMRDMVTLYPVITSGVENVIQTRATSFPVTNSETNVTSTYTDSVPEGTIIRVYAVPSTGADPVSTGRFTRTANGWSSSVSLKTGLSYSLYAHAPANMPGSSNLQFDRGNTRIRFDNLDIITTEDPWVCVSVLSDLVTEDVKTPSQTMTWHNFNIGQISVVQQTTPKTVRKVWMAMDHLYAKATVSFRLVPQYNVLRTIRVTDAKIVSSKSKFVGKCAYYFTSIGNGLTFLDGSVQQPSPMSIDLINGTTASDSINRRPELPDTVILSPDTLQFAWFCFLPDANKIPDDLHLEVTYDVMDGDSIIRPHQTVENSFPLKTKIDPKAGHNYKITVELDPTYLYVLWDGDADSKVKIKNSLE